MTLDYRTTDTETTLYDTETGEVLQVFQHKRKKKNGKWHKYVGVDVGYKLPTECITKDSLLASLQVLDGYIPGRTYVNSHLLAESVAQGLITPKELALILHVANHLTGWNIYIGTTKDLCTSGVTAANLARTIKKLNGVLKVTHANKPMRGDVVVQINPTYAWKGDLEYRDAMVELWYMQVFKQQSPLVIIFDELTPLNP